MAAVNVVAVVADIGAQLVPLGAVGLACLFLLLARKAFKWIFAVMEGPTSYDPGGFSSDHGAMTREEWDAQERRNGGA